MPPKDHEMQPQIRPRDPRHAIVQVHHVTQHEDTRHDKRDQEPHRERNGVPSRIVAVLDRLLGGVFLELGAQEAKRVEVPQDAEEAEYGGGDTEWRVMNAVPPRHDVAVACPGCCCFQQESFRVDAGPLLP